MRLLALVAINLVACASLAAGFYLATDEKPQTPEDWTKLYTCNQTWTLGGSAPRKCKREPTAWRHKYLNEISRGKYFWLVRERSIDQRLANSIYSLYAYGGPNVQNYRFDSGNSVEDERNLQLVAGSQVDNELCTIHLRSMLEQIQQFESKLNHLRSGKGSETAQLEENEIRLARVLDSYGRYSWGHLSGRLYEFGSYQQCLGTPLLLRSSNQTGSNAESAVTPIDSRFCWAHLSLDDHLSDSLKQRSRFPVEPETETALHAGVCLPSTCHSRSFYKNREQRELMRQIIQSQFEFPRSMYVEREAKVEGLFCMVDQDSPLAQWSTSGRLFLVCSAIWLMLIVLATLLYNPCSTPGCCRAFGNHAPLSWGWLACFDLKDSWHKFLSEDKQNKRPLDRPIDFDVLNLVRVLLTIIIIIGHSLLALEPLYANAMFVPAMLEQGRIDLLHVMIYLTVDAFFLISGIMVTFFSLTKLDKLSSVLKNKQSSKSSRNSLAKFWSGLALSRYARLVPLLFLAFWFKKSVFVHLGEGPLWDHGLNRQTAMGACKRDSWLTPFGFQASFLPLTQQCLATSWSIGNDLLYSSLVMPPIIWLYHKNRPKLATATLIAIVAFCMKLTIDSYHTLPLAIKWELEEYNIFTPIMMLSIGSFMRTIPHGNIAPYAVGVFAGYILYKYGRRLESVTDDETSKQSDGARKSLWPTWFRVYLTGALTSAQLLMFVGQCYSDYMQQVTSPEEREKSPIQLFTVNHLLFSSAAACLIIQMVTNWRHNCLMRFFSLHFWKVLSKLNFAIMLVHWDLFFYDIGTAQADIVYSRWNMFKMFSHVYLTATLIGVFVHLVIEIPLDKLISKRLLGAQ